MLGKSYRPLEKEMLNDFENSARVFGHDDGLQADVNPEGFHRECFEQRGCKISAPAPPMLQQQTIFRQLLVLSVSGQPTVQP